MASRSFKNRAGTIYLQKADNVDEQQWEVWFEDFCIIGTGNTEVEALKYAVSHATDIADLARSAAVVMERESAAAASGD